MPKKLAVFTSTLGCGGAERVLSTLINYWQKNKVYNVTLFTTYKESSFYPINDDIARHTLKSKDGKSKLSVLKNVIGWKNELKSELLQKNISTLICFGRFPNCIGSILNKNLGINTIICERSSPFARKNFVWRILPKLYYKYSTTIVLQTEACKPHFGKLFPLPPKVAIIKNPVSDEYMNQENNTTRKNIILCVGRLHPIKGHKHLIEALQYVSDWKDYTLHIIGDGSERGRLQKQIASLKLEDKVTLLGRKDDVINHYKNAKIFVLPSISEGYPNALVEASVMGCACISFDCNFGPSEIIKTNKSGILVETKNHKKLGEAIQELITNKELQSSLGNKAWSNRSNFALEVVAKEWENLIDYKGVEE